jgi:hypothetical protein
VKVETKGQCVNQGGMCTSNLKDKNDRPPAAPAGSAAADSRHYNVAISSLSSPLLQRSPAPVQRWLDSPLASTATTGVQVHKTYSVTVREKNHVLSREQRFPTNWFSDFGQPCSKIVSS